MEILSPKIEMVLPSNSVNILRVVLPERIGSVVVRELPYDEFERLFI